MGVSQRISSAYYPHGNTRAEVGVKSMKRLVKDNLGFGGFLQTNNCCQVLMEYRNTPDRDTKLSPVQVVFGRPIRDFIPMIPGSYVPKKEYLLTQERRDLALARR